MTTGIHHITAIASNAQQCLNFYSKILGLRLVKKTVNQDDVSTYHLFFGDKFGHPGMDLTFFIFQPAQQGTQSVGQVTTISLAVPESSLSFWQKRFELYKVKHVAITKRFGISRLEFWDDDGQHLELVGITEDVAENTSDIWTTEDISSEVAIRHFYSATLCVMNKKIMELIIHHIFDYQHLETENNVNVYSVLASQRAQFLEIEEQHTPKSGLNAAGTVHHIAFRVKDETQLLALREKVIDIGLYPTEEIDRFYFKSVYFRTPDGILFELATDGPGFTIDQNENDLGKTLALPPFLEERRKEIEKNLQELV